MNRAVFFYAVRGSLFGGPISQSAVDTMSAILDEWERRKLTDLRWLAYILATVLAEVGRPMRPVREGFKETDAEARAFVRRKGYPYAKEVAGHVFYGRGLVQLTWRDNYERMGKLLGLDLEANPDLALNTKIAVRILFVGMLLGSFTGRKLADDFNEKETDWMNARRIVNGLDRAEEIADYGRRFYSALLAAAEEAKPTEAPASPVDEPSPSPAPDQPIPVDTIPDAPEGTGMAPLWLVIGGGILAALIGAALLAADKFDWF